MKISTITYHEATSILPQSGQHILAHQSETDIVVYQAYRHSIADFALANQYLGGNNFSYNRMSWIKPNFLWMMYRCGWAEKENQERVLAFWIDKKGFEEILQNAVYSTYNPTFYENHTQWKEEMDTKDVRLQWDPDHDPFGAKLKRRAIQVGLKGKSLEDFGKKFIRQIEDITEFVKEQKLVLDSNRLNDLLVPVETVYKTIDENLNNHIGITQD